MGTRKSRHNKGRKPVYKDHRDTARHILDHKWGAPDFIGYRMLSRTWWTPVDTFKLEILCEADADIEGAADVFARQPKMVAHKARDMGFTLPIEWSRLIAPKYKPRIRQPKAAALAYPYITNPRDEHAQLLAVNEIIPKSIPDNMRADMCQEILLAILEGRTTLEALKAKSQSPSYFIKKFYHDNYEAGGHAISFQDTDEDWDSDSVASSIAAKEWQRERFAERTRYGDSLHTFTPPVQFEAAWQDQISRFRLKQHELGHFMSHEEAEEILDSASVR